MKALLGEYKETLVQTRVDARACEKAGNKNDALLHKAMERDLEYCIEWMTTGKEPQMYALERQSHEKRKVSFDFNAVEGALVLDPFKIQAAVENVRYRDSGVTKEELESREAKEDLVGAIKLSLTPRQIELLEFVAAGYTHEEVAEKLGITRRAVGMSIDSSRAKIKRDGWMMP